MDEEIGTVEAALTTLEGALQDANFELAGAKGELGALLNSSVEEVVSGVEGKPQARRVQVKNHSASRNAASGLEGRIQSLEGKINKITPAVKSMREFVQSQKNRIADGTVNAKVQTGLVAMPMLSGALANGETKKVEVAPKHEVHVNVIELIAHGNAVSFDQLDCGGNPTFTPNGALLVPTSRAERIYLSKPEKLDSRKGISAVLTPSGGPANFTIKAWYDPQPYAALRNQ